MSGFCKKKQVRWASEPEANQEGKSALERKWERSRLVFPGKGKKGSPKKEGTTRLKKRKGLDVFGEKKSGNKGKCVRPIYLARPEEINRSGSIDVGGKKKEGECPSPPFSLSLRKKMAGECLGGHSLVSSERGKEKITSGYHHRHGREGTVS